ncbi:hypothetical protein, partial [Escherichia coli]|uniref:hypothetical protein n=1 Tax=Escherichia coli TaxID=562 RepID=UPI003CE4558F
SRGMRDLNLGRFPWTAGIRYASIRKRNFPKTHVPCCFARLHPGTAQADAQGTDRLTLTIWVMHPAVL